MPISGVFPALLRPHCGAKKTGKTCYAACRYLNTLKIVVGYRELQKTHFR